VLSVNGWVQEKGSRYHWLAASAAFTAEVHACSMAQASGDGRRSPVVTFKREIRSENDWTEPEHASMWPQCFKEGHVTRLPQERLARRVLLGYTDGKAGRVAKNFNRGGKQQPSFNIWIFNACFAHKTWLQAAVRYKLLFHNRQLPLKGKVSGNSQLRYEFTSTYTLHNIW